MKKIISILLFLALPYTLKTRAQENAPSGENSGKKGFGVVTRPGQAQELEALKVSWFYSWGVDTPTDVPPGMQFVPMIWGWQDGPKQDQLFVDLTAKSKSGELNTLLG